VKNQLLLAALILAVSGFLWVLGPEGDFIGPIVHKLTVMPSSSINELKKVRIGISDPQNLPSPGPYETTTLDGPLKENLDSVKKRFSDLLQEFQDPDIGAADRTGEPLTLAIKSPIRFFPFPTDPESAPQIPGAGDEARREDPLSAILLKGDLDSARYGFEGTWVTNREVGKGKYIALLDPSLTGDKKRRLRALWDAYLREKYFSGSMKSPDEWTQEVSVPELWENAGFDGWGLESYGNGEGVIPGDAPRDKEGWLSQMRARLEKTRLDLAGRLGSSLAGALAKIAAASATPPMAWARVSNSRRFTLLRGELMVVRESAPVYPIPDSRSTPLTRVARFDLLDRDITWEGNDYYKVMIGGKAGYIPKQDGETSNKVFSKATGEVTYLP
jgi:hypothetical protein